MLLEELFWEDVNEILGDDYYMTIPKISASEISNKLSKIVAESLCENCKNTIRAKFRAWLLELKAEKQKFQKH